jgi:type II secretory pathway predicted ATPase ExeA
MDKINSILNHYSESEIWDYYSGKAAKVILDADYKHTFHIEYTNVEKLPDILTTPETIISSTDTDSYKEVKKFRDGHILIHRGEESEHVYDLYGYFHTHKEMKEAYDELLKSKPAVKTKDNQSPIHFWHLAKEAKRTIKFIDTPKWDMISQNYPSTMQDDLRALMELKPDNLSGGKLVLWRGIPGTGKTWGIRALTHAWKEWCTAHYIIDLDNFLSSSSVNYMLGMIAKIHANNEMGIDEELSTLSELKKPKKWNLLILEDAGELITHDAKSTSGSALTKLLNIGDGLLGQGMNLLILITTNQELQNIHEAISRQGRCLSNLEFIHLHQKRLKFGWIIIITMVNFLL